MHPTLRRAATGLLVTALALPAAGCSGLRRGEERDRPSFPTAWDARVKPYADRAAKLRGLDFAHPVHVEFQTPKEFEQELLGDEEELTADERAEMEQHTGMWRAMGLLHGDVDLAEESRTLRSGSTAAYYSFDDQKIRVRGTRVTPAIRSTLVHELVHVLQDQNFDAADTSLRLGEREDSSGLVYDALVEGDASRIETKYADQLPKKERAALRRDERRQAREARRATRDVPEVLSVLMGAPYALGEAMLDAALLDGKDAVDNLFRDPPVLEENLVDPFTLQSERTAAEVEPPALEDGQEEFDRNTFEATAWLLMLAARIPLPQALTATDGWGGDRYVAYTEDGRSCLAVRYVADTAADADEMRHALDLWIDRGPAGAATVHEEGSDGLLFTSCDPGTDARRTKEHSEEAIALAINRTYVTIGMIRDDIPRKAARCFATGLVSELELEEIFETDPSPALVDRMTRIAEGCRSNV